MTRILMEHLISFSNLKKLAKHHDYQWLMNSIQIWKSWVNEWEITFQKFNFANQIWQAIFLKINGFWPNLVYEVFWVVDYESVKEKQYKSVFCVHVCVCVRVRARVWVCVCISLLINSLSHLLKNVWIDQLPTKYKSSQKRWV